MFICGSGFVGGELACALTPTGIENINYVELKNGIYDDLYISKNTEFELSNECPKDWDFDTVLWAKFNNNTEAGNVDWSLETTSHIILKSRTEGNFEWKTIAVKEVNSIEDFVINYPDYFVASGQPVEYAIVPVLNGCEDIYASTSVTSRFDKMFLIEGETVWGTEITDGYCDTTRNIPSSNVELLYRRYPIFVRNTIANYDTGNCKGSFVPFDEDSCDYEYSSEQDYQRIKYQREFMDFICDSIPKILKLPDGRLWLIQVTPNPTDTANQEYNDREISWSWVEIGNVNSEEDLYYLGFSNVEQEWWSHV
ncbi:MAG: hypothetical protein NC489_27985 [Ruminococcus flavefaciens]|nr:hypothetical protein [Ruminococcus flavefaciens]